MEQAKPENGSNSDKLIEGGSFIRFLGYTYQHRKVLLLVFLVFFVMGILYTFLTPPVYKSTTTFFFPMQSQGSQLLSSIGLGGILGGGGSVNDHAVSILKSREISMKVIERFGLELFGKGFYENSPWEKKLRKLHYYVNIKSEEGIINVVVHSRDPELSAKVANYYRFLYRKYAQKFTLTFSKSYRIHVEKQRKRILESLNSKEKELLSFQKENGIVEPKSEVEALLTYYTNIKGLSVMADVTLEEVKGRLFATSKKLSQRLRQQSDKLSVPSTIDSAAINLIYNRLLSKELELANLLKTHRENNPQVVSTRIEIKSLQKMLRNSIKDYLLEVNTKTNPLLIDIYAESIASKAKQKAVEKVLHSLDKKLEGAPDLTYEYRRLMRDLMVKEKIYALMELEYQKSLGDEARNEADIQVLDKAVPADQKAWPIIRYCLAGTLFFALLAAYCVAGLVDKFAKAKKFLTEGGLSQ